MDASDGADVAELELSFDALSAATVAERGEIVLLAFLANAHRALEKLPEEAIRNEQRAFEATLLRILTQPSTSAAPCPRPGRPARNLVARAFVTLFSRVETRSLFDVLQSLVRAANDQKAEALNRVACLYVAGELMLAHGQQCMSMYAEVIASSLKIFRTSSLPVILRHAALLCLRKTMTTGGRSTSDALAKDILKALKSVLGDRAQAIQRASAEALLVFYEVAPVPLTLSEIEGVVTLCIRALEHVDFQTRRAFSRLAAGLLASTQVEGSAPVPEPVRQKKPKDAADDEDNDPYPSMTTAPADAKSKTLLSVTDMLAQLSVPFAKPATTRKTRIGIIDIYATLFTALGTQFVEMHCAELFRHITEELAFVPTVGPRSARFEVLVVRRLCNILLRDVIGVRILSETGQILALREIATSLLKRWPAMMPGQTAPSKMALLTGLDEAAGLITQLGSAPQPVQDVLYEPLVRLTGNPSRSIQVAAAIALRAFCHAAPTRLASTLAQLLEVLGKDLALLSHPRGTSGRPEDIERRTVGHAIAIAALISLVPARPLYVSFDISARVMSLAIQLLKQSGAHELHISGVEIEVAWMLVASLMRLGPNFVRLHLPQLLILWKNALPKPTSKDASAAQVRTETEWAFLLHIRECTLGALLAFFRYNGSKLVTADVGRRIAVMLNNGFAFAASFAQQHATLLHEQAPATSSEPNLVDRDLMLRRRLYQCYVALAEYPAALESMPTGGILTSALATFADPERYTGSLVQAAIAASSGNFTSIWEVTDGYGFGATTLADEISVELNRDLVEAAIDAVLRRPVQRAAEHDYLFVDATASPPPATGVVDAAVQVFATFFASQELQQQTAIMQQMLGFVNSPKLEKNPGRRMAILVNSVSALSRALHHAMQGHANSRFADNIAVPQLNAMMRDVVKVSLSHDCGHSRPDNEKIAVTHNDARLRALGSEALGRLAHVAGTSFMAAQIQFCVSQVVSNTDPSGRAGCARSFGEIYRHVGTMAAGSVLKTIVDVLVSLAADPHPLVHFWALDALASIIDSAGLSYSPYVTATLGMLTRIYMAETHEPEGGSPGSVNLRADLPAYQACCKVADALIRVLGPELQESDTKRQIVLILVREFSREPDEGVAVEASQSIQHFVMFAPTAIDLPQLVILLRGQMASSRRPLKLAAINGIYQLVQRDVAQMSKLGGDKLVEELFALLDNDPSIEGVRDTIASWLKQTAADNPIAWIDLCQRIMSRSNASTQAVNAAAPSKAIGRVAFADEEVQGIGLDSGSSNAQATSRWRTQLFALQCLHQVFLVLRASGRREHFDPSLSKHLPNRKGLLLSRVGDLIKMAFTASTAPVMDIRLEGVTVLRDVIENFSSAKDLDFEDALLLEQFQAPIAAALTPAFAADSYPEVLASAVQACAIFIGSGVVREVAKMGRILRLISNALESCKDADMSSIGDLTDLSSTAAVMLKTSIFAAWAELQVASSKQTYLRELVKPHLTLLCPFWVASLREYARFRTDPDALLSSSGGSSFESTYSGLSREVALPYYERSWSPMLAAVASLLKVGDPTMAAAMDGIDLNADTTSPVGRNPSDPALFFYVIFGLSFEALAAPATSSSGDDGRTQAIQSSAASLDALEGLASPALAGRAIMQEGLFDDLCNLCYRLLAIETAAIQARVVGVVVALARNYKADLLGHGINGVNGTSDKSAHDEDRMMRLVRLVCLSLQQGIQSTTSRHSGSVEARIGLLRVAFGGLLDLADLYPPKMRSDLYAAAFTFYSQILRDESSATDVISPSLPVLKMLLERSLAARQPGDELLPRVISGLLSATLQNIEDVRGRSSPAVLNKKRGNLLAAVLTITSLPATLKLTQASVEHCCFLISQMLEEENDTLVATGIHCAKTLVLACGRGIAALQYSVGQLLPGLVGFVARIANKRSQATSADDAALSEVLKTFAGLFAILPTPHHQAALGVFLPTLLMLVEPVSSPPTPQHAIAVSHTLQLAAQDSAAFKESMASLESEDRARLEAAIRQSVGSSAPVLASSAKPSIDLKLSF